MTCANHPDAPAIAYCRECGKPMCLECRRLSVGSIYCAEHAPAPPPPPPAPAVASPYTAPYTPPHAQYDPGSHPVLALFLGFIPGVGAIYNGQYAKGLIHAVIFGILVSLTSTSQGGMQPFFCIMTTIWVFYMAFEAFHTARKRRLGIVTEEFSSLFDAQCHSRFPGGGLLLVALGFILLLDTTGIVNFDRLERFWPVGLILFGFYLLYARLHSSAASRISSDNPRQPEPRP